MDERAQFERAGEVRHFLLVELYFAGSRSVQSIIGAGFDVESWAPLGTALANDYFTSLDGLTVRNLNTQSF